MKRMLAILLIMMLMIPVLPTIAMAEAPLKITFFDKNTGDLFENPVAEKIIEKTGITVEIQQPTGNPEEKLNLMLVSGDLPDVVLMDRRSTIVNKYITAGALVALNDMIDEYAPNVKEMYGDTLEKSRHTDGKNYYLNNWYGLDPDPDRAINIRMDILKECGFEERAVAGDYFTTEEFKQVLAAAKAKDDINGQAIIPFTLNSDYLPAITQTFKGIYGMKFFYETDGKIMLDVRDPRYLEMIKYFNTLYLEGLLDKEWAINKDPAFQAKASSGRVFATAGGNPGDANRILRTDNGEDTDNQFYMFRVVADGADPAATTFSPRSTLGWDAIGITVTNKHPIETMKFIDYLASEEGQYLLMWGVEGLHWDMVDGVHVPRPEVIPGFRENWSEYVKETGIRKWVWFIKNGYGVDGTPYDVATRYDRDAIGKHSLVSMAGSVWDTAPYDNIGPLAGTPEALIEQKLKDITDKNFAAMIYCESADLVEPMYNDMIAELDANQASIVEDIYTNNFNEQMALWS